MTDYSTTIGNVSTPYARKILPHGEEEVIRKRRVVEFTDDTGSEGSFAVMERLERPVHPLTEASLRGKGDNTQAILARGFAPGLVRKPHIDSILHRAYYVIHNEIERLVQKSELEGLSATEAKMLEGYVNSLKKLASEERAQRAADRVERMTDEELEAELFGKNKTEDESEV